MRKGYILVLVVFAGCVLLLESSSSTAAEPSLPLIDFSDSASLERIKPAGHSEEQVKFSVVDNGKGKALDVTIKAGKAGYPGVNIAPPGKEWNLSSVGRVDARILNTGKKPIGIALRVDNAGDWRKSPWNTEKKAIKPGKEGVVSVLFGQSWGKPGYALDSSRVVNILIFTDKRKSDATFRVLSLAGSGSSGEKPPLNMDSVSIKPTNGIIFGEGSKSEVSVIIGRNTIDWRTARGKEELPDISPMLQVCGKKTSLKGVPTVEVALARQGAKDVASIVPANGRWDLRNSNVVKVKIKNVGTDPVLPAVQVLSKSGRTDVVSAEKALAPGEESEITVPFSPSKPWQGYMAEGKTGHGGSVHGTGTNFDSDTVRAVSIFTKDGKSGKVQISRILADAPAAHIPEWLGKRPPAEGDWVLTFDEEFNSPEVDSKKWNIYGPNWWDKATHWTKENLVIRDGMIRLHYEKKHGFHNDNPDEKNPQTLSKSNESDYACGYLDTYGKWVQRYGYFEARVKLPRAPGLWPTFWLMPDRGVAVGPQWKRQDTANNGMEFDILEHLSRWGPYRYNIATHWDGYQKNHKSVGNTRVYTQADKDGFITVGMLWVPGKIVYYCNGIEVGRWETPRISGIQSNIIIEMTLGGWENDSVNDKTLPVDYTLDYVRVWQRKDLASDVDGYQKTKKE